MSMIGSLRGRVVGRTTSLDKVAGVELLLEVAGVGYRVTTTPATLSRLPADEDVLLAIHHHIREADQRLYGFASFDERDAFEGLLAAHGVGPALALAVLATYAVPELAAILNNEDLNALCEVPGVGKKTAQRLLVELKATVVLPVLDADASPPGAVLRGGENALADVRDALSSLGYSSEEIRRAVATVSAEGESQADEADSGQLLKRALLALAGG